MSKRRQDGEVSVFLGSSSSLEGLLTFTGQARVDGEFSGEIKGNGTLLVGPQARIRADIEAAAIVISGEVVGDLVATERIEIKAPGKLKGNISAALVVMDEGVLFEGHCSMLGEAKADGGRVTLLTKGNAA